MHTLRMLFAGAALIATGCAASNPVSEQRHAPSAATQSAATPAAALRDYYATVADADLPVAPRPAAPLSGDSLLTRIAIASCSEESAPIPLLRDIAAEKPDLFLYVGDNVYGDAYSGDMRLEELRRAYAGLAANPDFQAVWSAVPTHAVWDDHDYGLNDAGGDFSAREFAERIFERFYRLDEEDPRRGRPGVYGAYTYGPEGRRVQVILLDTRFFRSPLKETDERGAPGKERYVPDADPAKTMLGEAQWAWLNRTLREPADIRLLVSSIQVIAGGHGWEAWRTLPLERERLYRTIAETGAQGVVLISGDRHRAGLYRIGGQTGYPLYEMTASSLNLAFGGEEEPGPHRLGPTFTGENYGLVEIDWEAGELALLIKDGDGATVLSQPVGFEEIGVR